MAAQIAQPSNVADEGLKELLISFRWTSCCERDSDEILRGARRRLDRIAHRYAEVWGAERYRQIEAAAQADFEQEFGVYDPVGSRGETYDVRNRRVIDRARWYRSKLKALERSVGLRK
jgi:hypothetical protein